MKTRHKFERFEKEMSALCDTCKSVIVKILETALLLIGLYEVFRNHLLR